VTAAVVWPVCPDCYESDTDHCGECWCCDGSMDIAPAVDDCSFRMLEPHEIQAAMAFHGDYRVLGNRRERVKQLGNAVTPPAAEFLLGAITAALDGAA
jgi:site-specific DNA-cytosine methylase